MPPAPLALNDDQRVAALRSYALLDTQAEAAFDRLVTLAAHLTGCPIALVSLVDADRQWFKARVGLGAAATPRDHSFCAHAITDPARPLIVPDASRDARFADNPLVTGEPGIRFYAGVPLVNPEGHALGTLCVIDRMPREMEPAQLDALVTLAGAVATTIELRRAMREAGRMARTDALTGLANRPALLDALEAAMRGLSAVGEPFALLHLDLDGLRRVNDLQGQLAGDAALRQVAAVLTAELPSSSIAARPGGDEFAALLPGGKDAHALAERLRLAIKARMDAERWPVSASIGAVTFHAAPEDLTEALSAADEVLARAKAAGRNRALHFAYRRRAGAAAA